MRLFSIIQWHHFAYMIISLALLGYGISGTFTFLTQSRLLQFFRAAFITNVALFGVSAVTCFLVAQRIPFNAEELLWDYRQFGRLLAVYLVLTVPFFFAANTIALGLLRYRRQITQVYAADLLGAGLGSLAIILALSVLFPLPSLAILGALGITAAGVASWELRLPWRSLASIAAVLTAVAILQLVPRSNLEVSPYKGLSQALRVDGTRIAQQRHSPLGLLTVVERERTPFRHAPGLSLQAPTVPPPQVAVFTDADNMTVINQQRGTDFSYLDYTTSALPYHLDKLEHVLILGAGGGTSIQQALWFRAPTITAVELNPQLIELLRDDFRDFSGDLLNRTGVDLRVGDARGFVAGSDERYDLIQVALPGSFHASAAGLYALNENYLYTTEALQSYLAHLAPGGYLALSGWLKLPPRDFIKLFATAVASLVRTGSTDPGKHLALIRSWQTGTLIVKKEAFTDREIAAVKEFAGRRAFDVAWHPAIDVAEVNRFNILPQPHYYLAAEALLSPQSAVFFDRYKFQVRPATDDRPFFSHFFKWRTMPEIWSLRGRGGVPLLEQGYLVLSATLLKAAFASLVLILLPIVFFRRYATAERPMSRTRVLLYFGLIGLAFLFIEMAFIQRFVLFLHHPLYAISTTLAGFLVFAGIGSACAQTFVRRSKHRHGASLAITLIAVISISYLYVLPPLFDRLLWLPMAVKIFITLLLIAPLAFCMGMPFPLALARLGGCARAWIPWAWGVNGCASVISAVLATLLAIHWGFTAVVLLAVLLYSGALLSFPTLSKRVR